jgi:uncharacterized protein YaiI (UPF0178 family)
MLDLFVDIENCPVFPQIVRAAQRHSLDVYVVTCDYLTVDGNVHLILAQDDGGGAREWIGTNISRGDICVTSEPALARSCLLRGAVALAPNGRIWNADLINSAAGVGLGRRMGPDGLRNAWTDDPRTFAQRLEITIAAARGAAAQPSQRVSGFDHLVPEPAARPFPRPQSAVMKFALSETGGGDASRGHAKPGTAQRRVGVA